MKNLLCILLIILTPGMANAQSKFKLIGTIFSRKGVNPAIERQVHVHISKFWAAKAAVISHQPATFTFYNDDSSIIIKSSEVFNQADLKSPATLYGPHNYLKAHAKLAHRVPEVVSKRYQQAWNDVNQTGGYNGAHHIVNKYTIKLIHKDLKDRGNKVNLSEMEANAPAIFHQLHGRPEYAEIFHDAQQQYHDYVMYGMEVVVMQKLAQIDELNRSIGLTPLPVEYIENTLVEAELWCRHFGMNWNYPADLDSYLEIKAQIQERLNK